MTDILLRLGPRTTNTTAGGFDEQRFQKGGLKGSLVVVVFEANALGACFIDTDMGQKSFD